MKMKHLIKRLSRVTSGRSRSEIAVIIVGIILLYPLVALIKATKKIKYFCSYIEQKYDHINSEFRKEFRCSIPWGILYIVIYMIPYILLALAALAVVWLIALIK